MPTSQSPEHGHILFYMGKKDFADGVKIKEFGIERLSWVIQVDPIKLYESLKVENLFFLWSEEDVSTE